jgi:hypothetical protein
MSQEALVFWKLRKSSIIISAELHEKIIQNCKPIHVAGSEVVRVKPVQDRKEKWQDLLHDPLACFGS